ncbi:peroxisomal succinyl-coenzyme A thioesterase-like isoform X2 [Narcine bancroftii]|uniref:peroxisomal succinyl-coenzyme A thioesterase-like isoform X2 n=1 Tax=Narcine bancroftii TaxID=1343680 RepID=UPI0038321668
MKYFWMLRFIKGSSSNSLLKTIFVRRMLSSGRAINYGQRVAPLIKAEPLRGLVDESIKIEIAHLTPNQQVTLHSQILSEDDDWWMAYAHYVSDSEGTVRVSHDKSMGGTYTGQEPMGLIWSMKLAPGGRQAMRLRKKDITIPFSVTLSVYDGWISNNFDKEAVLALVVFERFYMAPGTVRLQIKEGRVIGTLFLPPGPGPFPAVLDMWGGGGGLVEYRAALLASRGYAALALAYKEYKDVPPPEEVFDSKLSYFEEAFDVLNNHPKIAKDRTAFVGLSLGFTVALLMATEIPNIHPKCLICISGSHIIPFQEGTELFVKDNDYTDKIKFSEEGAMIWRNIPLPFTDNLMPRVQIKKLMKTAGNDHLLTTIFYPQTGHLIEPPYSPHFRITKFKIHSINKTVNILWGGTTKPHSDAQEDSWKKILAFLDKHLRLEYPPAIQSKL